jgi:hypothetical protein
MTKRDWKVGDWVQCGSLAKVTSLPKGDFEYYVIQYENGDVGWANADELEPASELDAIERDMADIFARMRAAIERLK